MAAVGSAEATVRARGVSRPWRFLAGAFLVAALLVGLGIGPVDIGVSAIVESALSHLPFLHVHSPLSSLDEAVLWQIRAPRVVLAAIVGGMLAIAGSSYQGVFHNPLADPYLLGVAAGAGLGATLAIAYGHVGHSGQLLPLSAFVGGLAAVGATYVLGRSAGSVRVVGSFVLAGVTVTLFLTAIQTFVQQQHSNTLRDVYAWILGGFSTANWSQVEVAAPYVAVSSVAILLHRRMLDVLSVGDEEAASLGVNVPRLRLVLVIAATAGTAAAVSVSGLIAFVGIIVPHTIRLLVSTSYRAVVPLSFVVGAGFLVLADVLARTIVSPAELPIGVVTAFFGAPFFAVVLRFGEDDAVIELRDLAVRFGSTEAVRDLSLEVANDEWVMLIGPNGAGKTSVLRALCGLLPFDGDARVDGRDVRTFGRRELARLIAFVPQNPTTPSELTVAEYVLLGRTPHLGYLGVDGRRDRRAVAHALDRLDLLEFAERGLGSLSGGELQRAVLARALAQEAPILLLDEPTTSLDLGRQQQALELIDSLRRDGLTVLSTMHDLTLAGQYADRLVLLDRGALAVEGTPSEVLSAANLAAYYGASVRIVSDDGGLFVLPTRR